MKVIKGDINKINHIDGLEMDHSVVVVGNFDGIHTYHQRLLRDAEQIATVDNLQLIVVSFNQSFKSYYDGSDDSLLKDVDKINYFDNYFGVDYYVELTVNKNLEQMNAKQFMVWLKEVLHAKKIVEGSDFTFGTRKEGTIEDLREFFGVDNVSILRRKNQVSSTKIREYLANGKLDKANKLLFRPLTCYLEHVKGSETMLHISFPLIPIKNGYYEVLFNGKNKATINIGDDNNVSIVDEPTIKEDDIKSMILSKYLGTTLS